MVCGFCALVSRFIAHRWLWWLGIIVWGVVLFTLSSQSTLPPGPKIPYQDKVLHFIYFAGGGFCFTLMLFSHRLPVPSWWKWWLAGSFFGAVIGAVDEYHQTFTPGRSGNDVWDWLADLSGAGTGALLAWVMLAWARRYPSPKAG